MEEWGPWIGKVNGFIKKEMTLKAITKFGHPTEFEESWSCGERVPIITVSPGPAASSFAPTAGPRLGVASVPANAPTAGGCGRPPSR